MGNEKEAGYVISLSDDNNTIEKKTTSGDTSTIKKNNNWNQTDDINDIVSAFLNNYA